MGSSFVFNTILHLLALLPSQYTTASLHRQRSEAYSRECVCANTICIALLSHSQLWGWILSLCPFLDCLDLTIFFKLPSETMYFYQYRNFRWTCLKILLVVAVCLKLKDVLPRRNLEDGCSLVRGTKHFMLLLNGSDLFPVSVFCCLLKDSQNLQKAVLCKLTWSSFLSSLFEVGGKMLLKLYLIVSWWLSSKHMCW